MQNWDFRTAVYPWYMGNPVRLSGSNAESCLFRMLYNGYCRIERNGRTFDDTCREGSYWEDCSRMFDWYQDRYTRLGLRKGTKGQKRYGTGDETTYAFDYLYCDSRQFQNYLLTDTPQGGNQDLFCFVLHTAVAFLVTPGELDQVLQKLGFHPLHVRNIHHLAVYTVLVSNQGHKEIPPEYNPFGEVKTLYFKARGILDAGGSGVPEVYLYEDRLTREIRQTLFGERGLSRGNFEAVVQNNASALNMRHSLILDDFHRLSAVYTTVFEDHPEEEENHSFYQLVNQFCTPVSRKKFREYMGSMIDNNQKHPTRQVMILLWLYDYCFSFGEGIPLSDDTFEKIQKKLAKYNVDWAMEAKEYRSNLIFDTCGFINRVKKRHGSGQFIGSDFLTFINEKLLVQYGWGRLNERLPFDYYIIRLGSVSVTRDSRFSSENAVRIVFPSHACAGSYPADGTAPCPLVIITEILDQLKAIIGEESEKLSRRKAREVSPYPLDCRIYEQI